MLLRLGVCCGSGSRRGPCTWRMSWCRVEGFCDVLPPASSSTKLLVLMASKLLAICYQYIILLPASWFSSNVCSQKIGCLLGTTIYPSRLHIPEVLWPLTFGGSTSRGHERDTSEGTEPYKSPTCSNRFIKGSAESSLLVTSASLLVAAASCY